MKIEHHENFFTQIILRWIFFNLWYSMIVIAQWPHQCLFQFSRSYSASLYFDYIINTSCNLEVTISIAENTIPRKIQSCMEAMSYDRKKNTWDNLESIMYLASFPGSHAREREHWSCAGVEVRYIFAFRESLGMRLSCTYCDMAGIPSKLWHTDLMQCQV